MPITEPATQTYEIRPIDDGTWEIWLQGKLIERHPTQQQAIDAAKVRAAQEGAAVVWEDREGAKYGPVRPSRFGWFSPKGH
jgi:hypothetical protein